MKFLFIGQGYPGVQGSGNGSGIGMYVYELCEGLSALGHECHVLVWAHKLPAPILPWSQLNPAKLISTRNAGKITIHILPHYYYWLTEKIFPDKCDENLLAKAVLFLENTFHFDLIEIEHEEGIAIKAQRLFPEKTILRIHTTLAQMVDTKDIKISSVVEYRLSRERKVIENACFITVPSSLHARQLKEIFFLCCAIEIVPNGRLLGKRTQENRWKRNFPVFLVVGSADKRKGFHLLRDIMDEYSRQYGSCELRIVSKCSEEKKLEWGLVPPFPCGWEITWLENLSEEQLEEEYSNASVLLHPARYESFGLSLIEAAARETPVVCSRVGVAPDILGGELEKFIVESNEPKVWAERMHEAYRKGAEIGRILRKRYEDNYTREKIVNRFLEICERKRTIDGHGVQKR